MSNPAAATAAVATWGGGVEVHAAGAVRKSAFTQQLELQAQIDFDSRERLLSRAWVEGVPHNTPASHTNQPAHPPTQTPTPQPNPSQPKVSESEVARHQAAIEQAARQLDAATAAVAPSRSGSSGGGRGVGFWTDYLKCQLHPKSFNALPGVWHGAGGFEGWGAGEGLVQGLKGAAENAVERLRWWGEQCDSLQGEAGSVDFGHCCAIGSVWLIQCIRPNPITPQHKPNHKNNTIPGIQVFSDDLTGFGGLSKQVLDEMREELPGVKLLYFSLRTFEEESGAQGAGGSSGRSVR